MMFSFDSGSFGYLTLSPDSSSYNLTIPKYDLNSTQYFTWVERDLGQCVLALFKHYKDSSAGILDETFYAVSEKMTYPEFATVIEKGTVLLTVPRVVTEVAFYSTRKACSLRVKAILRNAGEYNLSYISLPVHSQP
jgi:hypothetical protein